MEVGDRPHVLVACSYLDDLRSVLRERLAEAFDVVPFELPTGSLARGTAVRAMSDIDVAVVVPPGPDDPALGDVMFEAGVAAGAGVPLVVVGDIAKVPTLLASGVIIRVQHVDAVTETITRLLGRRSDAVDRSLDEPGPPITADYASQWVARIRQAKTEQEALPLIHDLFAQAGARIRDVEQHLGSPVHRADLVIWDDNLAATVGVPLPIEVLLRWRSWPAVRGRLEQSLVAAGSRTLLALVLEDGDSPRVWTDGRRLVLVVSATALAEALVSVSLPRAIGNLQVTATA
jgi:hypothetical protein